jgi:light-regulated signal transduction histidine kinase (bacteriophytochrome)
MNAQVTKHETVDMEALAREAWDELDAAGGVTLALENLPPATGERAMLKAAWTHLLSTALTFAAGREKARIEVTGHQVADRVVYGVRENGALLGAGFSGRLAYFQDRIQEDYPGTAEGLTIVQRIVARHGGNVCVEARHDRGSVFRISLPLRGAA